MLLQKKGAGSGVEIRVGLFGKAMGPADLAYPQMQGTELVEMRQEMALLRAIVGTQAQQIAEMLEHVRELRGCPPSVAPARPSTDALPLLQSVPGPGQQEDGGSPQEQICVVTGRVPVDLLEHPSELL